MISDVDRLQLRYVMDKLRSIQGIVNESIHCKELITSIDRILYEDAVVTPSRIDWLIKKSLNLLESINET